MQLATTHMAWCYCTRRACYAASLCLLCDTAHAIQMAILVFPAACAAAAAQIACVNTLDDGSYEFGVVVGMTVLVNVSSADHRFVLAPGSSVLNASAISVSGPITGVNFQVGFGRPRKAYLWGAAMLPHGMMGGEGPSQWCTPMAAPKYELRCWPPCRSRHTP